MSTPAARARLDLTRLDDRLVPSTVTSTTTARPLDFTATGTLTTTDPTAGGDPVTTTNTVTLTGRIDYTSATDGTSGPVRLSGSGNGTGLPLPPPAATDPEGTTPTAPGTTAFAQVVQGQLSFADADGVVTVVNPLVGGAPWFTPDGGSGNRPLGPLVGSGSFDVSDYSLGAALGGGVGHTGMLNVTLADKTAAATDLKFQAQAAARGADGSVGADFTVGVTGKLMTADSHSAAAARVTAVWGDGAGRTQAADLDVPVYWNTGKVVVSARGLTPPSWATTLTVKLDAAGRVTEADETNNTWTVNLAGLSSTPLPPPTAGGTGDPTSPPPASPPPPPDSPPPPPPATPGRPAGFSISPGIDLSYVEWHDVAGRVIRSAVAFDGFDGDVGVGVGDVTGDGVPDVALAAGAGGGPRVRVLDGASGAELANFFAYDPSFRGGVNVAVGDLDGDGHAEVVVGSGVGGGPHVRVFEGVGGMLRYEFMAYEESARGGVSVAAADLDGDGKDEILTGAGVGGGPVIAVFAGNTGVELQRVLAGSADDRGGARVRAEKNATTGKFLVTAESEETGSLRRFRQQLSAGEGLLVMLDDPPVYPSEPVVSPALGFMGGRRV